MIDANLAGELKRAGLAWQPAERDCFTVPDSQLEGQVFVVSQLTTQVEVLKGRPALTFHGSSEWALDYLFTTDAVWLPSETQLRQAIERLSGEGASLVLERTASGYRCGVAKDGQTWEGTGSGAEEAYAQALLALLRSRNAEG